MLVSMDTTLCKVLACASTCIWYMYVAGDLARFMFGVKELVYQFAFVLQTLYDPFFITLYNLLFTPLPVMALANFEQVGGFSHNFSRVLLQ